MRKERSYLDWKPVISAEEVFSDLIGFAEIKTRNDNVFWLEIRPSEQGRTVLVRQGKKNFIETVTPQSYNLRTRVHEYGGGVYDVDQKYAYFVNYADQRIYKQNLSNYKDLTPITPRRNKDGSLGKYGALTLSPDAKFIFFIYEKEFDDKENKNFLACLKIDEDPSLEPNIIHKGYDFYGEPEISPNGKKLAWLSWNHPHMPWDETVLWMGYLRGGELLSAEKIYHCDSHSICFPKFNPKGKLFFVKDEANKISDDYRNWWNFYYYDKQVLPATKELKEFGQPLWLLGQSHYVFLDQNTIICKYYAKGRGYLGIIDLSEDLENRLKKFENLHFTEYGSLSLLNRENLMFDASSPTEINAIYRYNIKNQELTVLKKSSEISLDKVSTSKPKLISCKIEDNNRTYAHYYSPKNQNYESPKTQKPPLLVMVHGGPTARSRTSLSLSYQFWTSSGFALLDVDYRGSTGYGRRYRDALRGNWGIIDAQDIKRCSEKLKKEGIVAENMCAISGGSAGGYSVQRALTMFPDLFRAGASYFGIGNLITLVQLTHKFESHYIDNLVGGSLKSRPDIYKDRSPINHLEKLSASMIIFQGSEDKIVPPQVSREMAEILNSKGIKNTYIEYGEETHGFRIRENKIDALKNEFAFYRDIFKKNK
ncbi:MAG: prolyl oligopeptidase family serine peptidase [Candidatus Lokiarchaeota archaeon]|nr:prolyl oligopeptidase family serine peptidase [Candidatus Lokiarchaeota archaeon]MBD3338164.1 prolyl oligopeptidase family serine peptidase [Candidatus Lokiarchaeota archaeon]